MLHSPTQRRRVINTLVLLVACGAAVFMVRVAKIALGEPAEWSGWMLAVSALVLLLYAARKRLSTLPLGRVAHWLQVHLYLGVFCLFVFLLHTGWRWPNGIFESVLALSFIGTILTGLLGIYWSRTVPSELTRLGDEVIYERIKGFTQNLRETVESEVLQAVEGNGSKALADFYQAHGHRYFSKPRFQWARLYQRQFPNKKIHQELELARRFMTPAELERAEVVKNLVEQKNRLDAHYTWQGVLKYWLQVHLAFSLSMIPLVLLHIVLAYSFALSS